jgi:hypothetical protein
MKRTLAAVVAVFLLLALSVGATAAGQSIFIPVVFGGQQPTATATRIVVPATATSRAEVCLCSSDLYNCVDFGTHALAQDCFEYCLLAVGLDVHRLDADGDLIACERWP